MKRATGQETDRIERRRSAGETAGYRRRTRRAAHLWVLGLAVGSLLGRVWLGPGDRAAEPIDEGTSLGTERSDLRAEAFAQPIPNAGPASVATPPRQPVAVATGSGRWVRVLHGHSDRGVPDAELILMDPLYETLTARWGNWLELDWHAGKTGDAPIFRTDSAGRAWVPGDDWEWLVCSHDGLWGETFEWHDLGTEEVVLRLFPDTPLGVRVVDSRGWPAAGAEVSLLHLVDDEAYLLTKRIAGDDGRAVFSGMVGYLNGYEGLGEQLAVGVTGVFGSETHRRFVPQDLPLTLEVGLPLATALAVELTDARGDPFREPALVRVRDPDREDDREATVETDDGFALLRQIGPDLELEVEVETLDGADHEPIRVRSAPRPGERVTLRVPLVPILAELTGRVVTEDGGVPAADARVRVSEDPSWTWGEEVRLDAGGRFRFHSEDAMEEGELVLDLIAEEGWARIPIPTPLPPGRTDLGTVRLQAPILLAAGRVVDAGGRGLGGAWVSLTGRAGYRTEVDRDGGFRITGPPTGGPLTVGAGHPGRSIRHLEGVALGTNDLELVLPAAGALAGSLVVESRWQLNRVSVELMRDADALSGEESDTLHPDANGYLYGHGLTPGTWSAAVWLEGDSEPALWVPDIEIREGALTRDPRLQQHPLGVRVVRLWIDDPQGQPIDEARVYHRASGGDRWGPSATLEGGQGYVVTAAQEVDLFVVAPDRAGVRVLNAGGEVRVVLGEPIKVRVRWEPATDRTGSSRRAPFFEIASAGYPPHRIQLDSGWPWETEWVPLRLPIAAEYACGLRSITGSCGLSYREGAERTRFAVGHRQGWQEVLLAPPIPR